MAVTVAIDGPAGAGKSTVAQAVARRLDYTLVDTGAIYRAVALAAKRRGAGWKDADALRPIVDTLEVSFRFEGDVNRVFLGDEDVTTAIRTEEMSMGASTVSAQPVVRRGLLALQRRLAGAGGAVLEGRDIGTVVFPEAEVKIYLDAAPQERARRRWEQLREKAADDADVPALETILDDVLRRDKQDMERAHAPLKPADDALILDSTRLTENEVIDRILARVRQAAG